MKENADTKERKPMPINNPKNRKRADDNHYIV